jgi:hypothetical protein
MITELRGTDRLYLRANIDQLPDNGILEIFIPHVDKLQAFLFP